MNVFPKILICVLRVLSAFWLYQRTLWLSETQNFTSVWMYALLFCFQWLKSSYWNVDPKITIQKKNILHHLVDSIIVKRHCPCQGLAYCVLPQVTCLMNTKYRWFLKPDGKAVRMRHVWGVWDGQVKRNLQVKAILVIINGNIKDPGEVILEFRSFSKTWQRPFPPTTHN